MQELRFVAVSEDGSYAVLAVPGRSARFILPIDERLRAVALGQTSRLAQYEIEVESPLRPKEIQARIRAGETAEEIADAAGIPVERVRWFEGPVLAERAYIAQQAQTATVRRQGDSAGPGPRLEDIVAERMTASGGDPEEGQWDSRKRGDGSWQVQLTYSAGGRLHIAEWMFDPRRRHVMPEDDTAARLSLPESELPPPPETLPGEATVTPIAPRLGAAAGMGGGMDAGPAAYAPPPAPPVTPRPVSPPPDPSESERIVPSPPTPSDSRRGEGRRGAPWSESARRAPDPVAYQQGDYQQGDYQFEDNQTYGYETGGSRPGGSQPGSYQPAPERAPVREPAPAEEPAPAARAEPEVDASPAPEPEPAPAAEPVTPDVPAQPTAGTRETDAPARADRNPAEAPENAGVPSHAEAPAKKEPPKKEPAPKPAAKRAVPTRPSPAKKETAAVKEPAKATEPARPKEPAKATEPAAAERKPAAEEQQPSRPRPARKNPRNRRSSVPSWDEIMLGSSRQRD